MSANLSQRILIIIGFALFVLCSLVVSGLFAQAPDTVWSHEYAGLGRFWPVSVKATPDGGCVLFGQHYAPSGPLQIDGELVKISHAGDVEWIRSFGRPENNEYVFDGVATHDGGFLLAGTGVEIDSGRYGMIAVKYDAEGDSLWSNPVQIDSSAPWVVAATQALSGELVFASQSNIPSLIWLDSTGQLIRHRSYAPFGYHGMHVRDLVETANANLVLLVSILWLDSTSEGAICVNSIGDTLWTRWFSDPPGLSDIQFIDACGLEGDSLMIAGYGQQVDTLRSRPI